MCKLVELVDFIVKRYGHVKLYIHSNTSNFMMLAEDLPYAFNDCTVKRFKYCDAFKQLDVYL